jgi:Na+-driven multidrug efflux pump
VVPLTSGYLFAISFGLPGVFAFLAMRFMSEGVGWTRPIMYAAAVGLVVNVFGNWVLMYGNLGFPRLGAVGCGMASAIAMWSMFATLLIYVCARGATNALPCGRASRVRAGRCSARSSGWVCRSPRAWRRRRGCLPAWR